MEAKRVCTICICLALQLGFAELAVAEDAAEPKMPAVTEAKNPKRDSVPVVAPESPIASVEDPSKSLTRAEVKTVREMLQKNSTFAFGLSIGPRFTFDRTKSARSASVVTPGKIDTENADRVDMVLSGVVVAKPFNTISWLKWLGFIAKLDIAQFDVAKVAGPAKSIEGGVGLALRLNDQFFLGATFDRVYARSLRKEAENINKDPERFFTDSSGNKITTASLGDDRYFVDDYLSGMSVVLVFLP